MKKFFALSLFIFFSAVVVNAQQDSTLKEYLGNYTFSGDSPISYVNVGYNGGSLGYSTDRGDGQLIKEGLDSFSAPAHSGKVYFKRDSTQKVVGVIIDAMGYHLIGTKDKPTTMVVPLSEQKQLVVSIQEHLNHFSRTTALEAERKKFYVR
jgi:hypothetical protein